MLIIKRLFALPLFRNLSWMLAAEGMARVSRLVTLFVLAAWFSTADYGLAMLALIIHELFRVFTRIGTGARIIQCQEQELKRLLPNAASLQWLVTLLIAGFQVATAELIASFYKQDVLAELLRWMALAHLFYPAVAIRIFILQRSNQLRYYGLASGTCVSFENLLVAGLVLSGAGLMAVVYAKIGAALAWVLLFWRLPSPSYQLRVERNTLYQLLSFSCKTLGSELARTLRMQADSLIGGRLLSPEAFGLYSFAKSAGLGIAQSLSSAYQIALYPQLCQSFRQGHAKNGQASTRKMTATVMCLFAVQAAIAPFYVEWLFGERWSDALGLVSLLCLVALPTILIDHAGLELRARGLAYQELRLLLSCSALLLIGIIAYAPATAMELALSYLLVSLLWLVLPTLNTRTRKSLPVTQLEASL